MTIIQKDFILVLKFSTFFFIKPRIYAAIVISAKTRYKSKIQNFTLYVKVIVFMIPLFHTDVLTD